MTTAQLKSKKSDDKADMANHSLKTVVAHTLVTIYNKQGYVSPAKSKTENTPDIVLKELQKTPAPKINFEFTQLADEIVEFFKNLRTHPDYKAIRERADGPEFESCADAAQNEEVSTTTFPFAVLMAHLYGRLNPRRPKIDLDSLEVKLLEPGHYMGTIGTPEKFFVKLVYVGREDEVKGTTFKVTDRSGNIGFFQDRANRYEGKVYLNDCFYIVATPIRHLPAENNEKHTIFRSNVLPLLGDEPIIQGRGEPDPSNDESVNKKFTRNGGKI